VCEPNTEHYYAPDWRTFRLDRTTHAFRFNYVLSQVNKYWLQNTVIRLMHVQTRKWLNFVDSPVPAAACGPVCARRGIKLALGLQYDHAADQASYDVGLPPQEENCASDITMNPGTALKQTTHCVSNGFTNNMKGQIASNVRDGVRFFTQHVDHIAFESDLNSQLMLKRFLHLHRRIRRKDFVAWREFSEIPCMQKGRVMVGIVHQVYEVSKLLEVETWLQVQDFYGELPVYSQTLSRENSTVSFERVYGPLVSQVVARPHPSGLKFAMITMEFMKEKQPDKFSDRGGDLTDLASSIVNTEDHTVFEDLNQATAAGAEFRQNNVADHSEFGYHYHQTETFALRM